MVRLFLIALLAIAPGCMRPVQRGRTEKFQPATRAEQQAAERVRNRRCSPRWGLLFPGLGHACHGQDAEALVLCTLGAGEIGTAVAAASSERGADHPALGVSLVALQDLWLIGALDPFLDTNRAAQLRY